MSFSLATAECASFLLVVGRKRETPGIFLLHKLKINLLVCKSFDFEDSGSFRSHSLRTY